MTVFEYLILISVRFCRILLLFLPRLVLIEKIHQTYKTMHGYIFKYLEIREKLRRVTAHFQLFSRCGHQTCFLLFDWFDILHLIL